MSSAPEPSGPLHHHAITVEPTVPNGALIAPVADHVRTLDAEIARRSQVEDQLRDALAKLQESEERERERAARLEQLVEGLVDTVRMNELLTGVLAHDLRNPLGAITTAAQLAQNRRSDRDAPLMRRIVTSADRMARMIDQLLDFTRIRVGSGVPLDPTSVDLEPVLVSVIDELRQPERTGALRVEHAGDTRGSWDSDRLAQAFSNLLGNAIQHGDPGTISIRVDGTHPERVCVRIENGGAIAAALVPHLFEPMTGGFRQGTRGLGLGLYITHEIITAHGGTITVEPSETSTVFVVVLPRTTAAPAAPTPAPANDQHDAAGIAARSPALFAKASAEKRVAIDGSGGPRPTGRTLLATVLGSKSLHAEGVRERPHELLRLSEERFRFLVENVRDYAIFLLDPTGHVMSWNAGAELAKGYRAREIIGAHFSTFYREEDVRAGKCEMELEGAIRDGRYEDEGWRVRKDGTEFWANVVITALRDETGRLLGFAKVTRDLTERRQLEDQRVRFAHAQEGIRLRDEFLSIVSHELKTPLTGLQLQIESLERRIGETDPRTAAKLRQAAASGERLAGLIESLLDVSRISTGRFVLSPMPFDLAEVVEEIVDTFRAAADKAGCVLRVTTIPIQGHWDRVRIGQVITNLLSNAIKYAGRGTIEIGLSRSGGEAELIVRDHGPGIPVHDLARVFERFERASSLRHYGGLGVGLYVVREIVHAHGGSVSAENAPDGGARFMIRIPVDPPPVAPR